MIITFRYWRPLVQLEVEREQENDGYKGQRARHFASVNSCNGEREKAKREREKVYSIVTFVCMQKQCEKGKKRKKKKKRDMLKKTPEQEKIQER
jgi:hypothetical protein